MKKILVLSALLATGLLQIAHADQLSCRGKNTTMKITDVNGQDESNFVYVELWRAEYDRARYADLYAQPLTGRLETVAEVMTVKTFTSKGFGGQLAVNMENKTLSITTKNGLQVNDSFDCKLTPMKPVVPTDIGG